MNEDEALSRGIITAMIANLGMSRFLDLVADISTTMADEVYLEWVDKTATDLGYNYCEDCEDRKSDEPGYCR